MATKPLPVNYISNDVVNQRVLLYRNGTHSMPSSAKYICRNCCKKQD